MANNKIITLEPSDPGYPWIFRAMGKEMPQKIWVQGDVGLLKHPRLVAVAAARRFPTLRCFGAPHFAATSALSFLRPS